MQKKIFTKRKFFIPVFILAFILSLFTITGCSNISKNYYPLKIGNEWLYSTNIGMNLVMKVEERSKINDTDCLVLSSYAGSTDPEKYIQKEFYAVKGKDVLCYKRSFQKGIELILNPPEKMISTNPKIGEKWSWESKDEKFGTKFEFFVEKEEKITLNNKSYDCMKLKVAGSSEGGINYDISRWFANKIGMVKEVSVITRGENKLFVIAELKEYKLEK